MDEKKPHALAAQVARQVLSGARKPQREALIVHCLARAVIARNGWEKSEEQAKAGTLRLNQWVGARVAPKATRVAMFIGSWAAAMGSEGRDEYTITEYARFWNEVEREAYRYQREFRELWPEYETPNELSRKLLAEPGMKGGKAKDGKVAPVPMSVQVTV
jgi:hypothetical protein